MFFWSLLLDWLGWLFLFFYNMLLSQLEPCKVNVQQVRKTNNEAKLIPFLFEEQKMYRTHIGLFNEEQKEAFTKICSDIAQKDSTFKYVIKTSVNKKYTHILVVESKDKDQAYQRGQWLISKTGYHGLLLYWVKQT